MSFLISESVMKYEKEAEPVPGHAAADVIAIFYNCKLVEESRTVKALMTSRPLPAVALSETHLWNTGAFLLCVVEWIWQNSWAPPVSTM